MMPDTSGCYTTGNTQDFFLYKDVWTDTTGSETYWNYQRQYRPSNFTAYVRKLQPFTFNRRNFVPKERWWDVFRCYDEPLPLALIPTPVNIVRVQKNCSQVQVARQRRRQYVQRLRRG